jgi:hypothetical protein
MVEKALQRRITVVGRYVPEASYSINFPDRFYDILWNKVFPLFSCDHTSSDFCAGVCLSNIKRGFFYAKPGFSKKLDNQRVIRIYNLKSGCSGCNMVNPDRIVSDVFNGKDIMADREVFKRVVDHEHSFPCGKRVGGFMAVLGASYAYYQFVNLFCNPRNHGMMTEMIRLKTSDIESSCHSRFQLLILNLIILLI